MRLERVTRMHRRDESDDGRLRYYGPMDGASFRVNYVEIAAGAESHSHRHPWEQANYIIGGRATLYADGETHRVRKGDLILLEADEPHRYVNDGEETLQVLGILGPGVMEAHG